jgi:hypothetical protein
MPNVLLKILKPLDLILYRAYQAFLYILYFNQKNAQIKI